MTQADSNRARFFSRGQDFNPSNNAVSVSEKSLSVIPAGSNVATTRAMVASTLNSTNSNEDDIIAQRTCMIETETLFKPRKDRNGKLNLSGLIKENKKPRDNPCIMPSAMITEVTDKNSENSLDPNDIFPTVGNTSLAKPHTLNAQSTAFAPSNLNVLAISDITVETPINKKPFNVKESSRGDHLVSNEALLLSGNQHNSLQPGDYTSATTLRAVIGTKDSLLGSTINKLTAGSRDEQYALMTSYNDIRKPGFLAETSDANGKCVQRNGEKRRNDIGEAQLPDSVVAKKRKKNNGMVQSNLQQINSSPESYVSNSTDGQQAVTATHPPPSSSLATVLGRDIENYIASHLDEYGRAKARWTECSREEWEQGALEIAARFTRILDFVKDHMRHKIMLYANLQTKLDDHRSLRDGIANMLTEAKNELVTKTGGLIEERKSG